MKCKVKNCRNWNQNAASECSFFKFPSDKETLKKWISFCRQEESFNVKTSFVCMKHFTNDDFANNMQFEMGFAKNRMLKREAVPSIYKPLASTSGVSAERENRIRRRENKKVVNFLLHEHTTSQNVASDEGINNNKCTEQSIFCEDEHDSSVRNFTSAETMPENLMNSPLPETMSEYIEMQSLPLKPVRSTLTELYIEEMEILRKQIDALRKENSWMQIMQTKYVSEIEALKQSAIAVNRKNKLELKQLKKRLVRKTTDNIDKRSNNRTWAEDDTTHWITP